MNKLFKSIAITISISIVLILTPFILKFHSLPTENSTPTDWVVFSDYFEGMFNSVLTVINIFIFVVLTLSVQRATENKTLVSKTEEYILKHYELYSFLVSEVMFQTSNLEESKGNLSNDEYQKKIHEIRVNLVNLKAEYKRKIYKNQYDLRIFAENQLFKLCPSQKKFIDQSKIISEELNKFFSLTNGNNEEGALSRQYNIFETELKRFIEIGKKFSDEIYKI
jgi:hypothetical protein